MYNQNMNVRCFALASATTLATIGLAQSYVSGHHTKNGAWVPGHYTKTRNSPLVKPLKPLPPLGGRALLRRNNTNIRRDVPLFFQPVPSSSAHSQQSKPFWSDFPIEAMPSHYAAPPRADNESQGGQEIRPAAPKPPAPPKTSVYVRFTSDSKVIITGSSDSQFAYGDRIISIKQGYDAPISTDTAKELQKFLRTAKPDTEAIVRVERNGRYRAITVASLRILALEL